MGKIFQTAAAFRVSLETRLKKTAAEQGIPFQYLRLKVAIERLLARLFAIKDPPWLLKGGYAMELRYRPRARTTKDIDLSARTGPDDLATRMEQIRDQLQAAAEREQGDYFQFQIATASSELQGAPDGGGRFPVTALLAGKEFVKFHLDLGFGDVFSIDPEELTGEDYLGFAGVEAAKILAIPKAQQFAEKLHAYTLPWTDRPNTRTKDLVDLSLFVTLDRPDEHELRSAVKATFEQRKTHEVPNTLPPPPSEWSKPFSAMAKEAQLPEVDMQPNFQAVSDFWFSVYGSQS